MFRSLEKKNKKDLRKLEEIVQSTIHRLQVSRFIKKSFVSYEQFYVKLQKSFTSDFLPISTKINFLRHFLE